MKIADYLGVENGEEFSFLGRKYKIIDENLYMLKNGKYKKLVENDSCEELLCLMVSGKFIEKNGEKKWDLHFYQTEGIC